MPRRRLLTDAQRADLLALPMRESGEFVVTLLDANLYGRRGTPVARTLSAHAARSSQGRRERVHAAQRRDREISALTVQR